MSYRYTGKRKDNGKEVEGWLIINSLIYGTQVHIRVPSEGHEDTDHDYEVDWPSIKPVDDEVKQEIEKWKGIAKASIDAAEDSSRKWHLKELECEKLKDMCHKLAEIADTAGYIIKEGSFKEDIRQTLKEYIELINSI